MYHLLVVLHSESRWVIWSSQNKMIGYEDDDEGQ